MRFLIALLLASIALNAQQSYYFKHYQVESGLSNNTIFCSMQDNKGFMWFGTKDGLNRFDGYQFKAFNISNDERSLKTNLITSLMVDKQGTLWVGSLTGLYWFNAEKERFESFIDTLHSIKQIWIDKPGQLWFVTTSTICRYNFQKKKLTTFPSDKYFNATSVCEMEDGTMWFSTSDGYLAKFSSTTETFKKYNVFSHSPAATSQLITKLQIDKNGSILIGTST